MKHNLLIVSMLACMVAISCKQGEDTQTTPPVVEVPKDTVVAPPVSTDVVVETPKEAPIPPPAPDNKTVENPKKAPVAPMPPKPPKDASKTKAEDAPKPKVETMSKNPQKVAQGILQANKNVEISRITKDGKKYFKAQMNVYDGGEKIYDENGKQVASCTPMMHKDPLCNMEGWEIIYTPAKNIWGHKAVDVLEIAN